MKKVIFIDNTNGRFNDNKYQKKCIFNKWRTPILFKTKYWIILSLQLEILFFIKWSGRQQHQIKSRFCDLIKEKNQSRVVIIIFIMEMLNHKKTMNWFLNHVHEMQNKYVYSHEA